MAAKHTSQLSTVFGPRDYLNCLLWYYMNDKNLNFMPLRIYFSKPAYSLRVHMYQNSRASTFVAFELFCVSVSSIINPRYLQAFAKNFLLSFRSKHWTTEAGRNLKRLSGPASKQQFVFLLLPFTGIYLPFFKLTNDYANPNNSQNKFWSLCGILKEVLIGSRSFVVTQLFTLVQMTVAISILLIAAKRLAKKLSRLPAPGPINPVGSLLAQQSIEEQLLASASAFAIVQWLCLPALCAQIYLAS